MSGIEARGGSILVTLLVLTTLVTGAVLVATYAAARRLHGEVLRADTHAALHLGRSGHEIAAELAASTANWRANLPPTTWFAAEPLGEGSVTVEASDPADGVIAVDGTIGSSDADTILFTSDATVRDVTRRTSSRWLPLPHDALRFAVFSETQVLVGGVRIEGRVRGNGEIQDSGKADVYGDITTLSGMSVSPSLDDGDTDIFYDSQPLSLPAIDFSWFQAAGEEIALPTPGTTYTGIVLSPASNPYGSPSPSGIYWIDAGGGTINFVDCAIDACVAVTNVTAVRVQKTFTFDDDWSTGIVHHSPDSTRLPAFVVDGDLDMIVDGAATVMHEGTPTASDLNGVFVCTGRFTGLQADDDAPFTLFGAILANEVVLDGNGSLIRHDPALNRTPLVELAGAGLRPLSGTFREL